MDRFTLFAFVIQRIGGLARKLFQIFIRFDAAYVQITAAHCDHISTGYINYNTEKALHDNSTI